MDITELAGSLFHAYNARIYTLASQLVQSVKKKSILPDKIPSHPIVPVRISPEEKKAMKEAASKDGKALGTWFKWLARKRMEEIKKSERSD